MGIIDKPGIYEISESDYHADPCPEPSLSSSVAKVLIDRSPLHATLKHPKLNPDYVEQAPTTAMRLGKAAHAAFLEGNTDWLMVIDAKDWRKDVTKMKRDAALEKGFIPLLPQESTQVMAIYNALKRQVDLPPGKPEQTVIWQDEGIWCRARVDWLPTVPTTFFDLKCTDLPATPEGWGLNQIWEYAMQWGIYTRGVNAMYSGGHIESKIIPAMTEMKFIVQEMKPPYECSIFTLDEQGIDYAELLAYTAISLWADCLKRNHWPGYPKGPTVIETPAWIHYRAAKLEERA